MTAYDYGFRIYNPALGKFLSVDPLTASYPWYTPYQFAGNKPINSIDLDGLEEFPVFDRSVKVHPKAEKQDNHDVVTYILSGTITVKAGLIGVIDAGLIGGKIDLGSFKIGEIKSETIFDENFKVISAKVTETNFMNNKTGKLQFSKGGRGEVLGGLSHTTSGDFDVVNYINELIISKALPEFDDHLSNKKVEDKLDFLFLRMGTNERDDGTINGFVGVEEDAGLGLGVAGSITVKFLRNVKNPTTPDHTLPDPTEKKLSQKEMDKAFKTLEQD